MSATRPMRWLKKGMTMVVARKRLLRRAVPRPRALLRSVTRVGGGLEAA